MKIVSESNACVHTHIKGQTEISHVNLWSTYTITQFKRPCASKTKVQAHIKQNNYEKNIECPSHKIDKQQVTQQHGGLSGKLCGDNLSN